MKIIMYSVHEGENKAIEEYIKRNNIEITTTDESFNIDTYHMAKGYDGVCIQQSNPVTDEIIYQKMAEYGIKQISLRTVGYDIINFEYAKKYNLLISNVPAYSPNAIAEMALTHTMYLIRKMYVTLPKIACNNFTWQGSLAPEIRKLTVGIIGVGRIGSVYAKLVNGLGAKIIGYDIKINPENIDIVEYKNSLQEVLSEADIISLHVPLDESTTNMFNKEAFKLMKSNAYLVNTSRGQVVNSDDLIDALNNKEIAGAGLDTIDCEVEYFSYDYTNKNIDSKQLTQLLKMPNVLITPHISFYTETALENMVDISLDSLLEILNTGTCQNLVGK